MGRYKPFGFLGNKSKIKKKYKKRKSVTTNMKVGDLYGEKSKTKNKSKKNKKKKPLQAEEDPWARLERLQKEAKEAEEAAKAYDKEFGNMPTPDLPGSYEDMYLKSKKGFGDFTEGHMQAQQQDRQRDKKANTPSGPPSQQDMLNNMKGLLDGKLGAVQTSNMEGIRQDNPLGMDMYLRNLKATSPQDWKDFQIEYGKTAQPTVEGIINEQRNKFQAEFQRDKDERIIGTLKDDLMGAKKGYNTGGKMKYNFAGQLPGAIQGLMGTAAMANQGSFTDLPWQHQAGRIMQGASGIANLIPGAGPLVGMGLNLAGGALQTMGAPQMTDPTRMNQNPMGMQFGGNMNQEMQTQQGGNFKGISNNAMEVQAHNPGQTDSVDAGPVMLDDNEVVVGDKVFSDTLRNPATGMKFSEQEKENQKVQGKFEKFKVNTGDTEMKDDKYHKRNTQNLFNAQEHVATGLGLRNQNGTPKQVGGAPQGMWSGGDKSKLGYNNGGPILPGTSSVFDINQNYLAGGPGSQGINFLPFNENPFDPTSDIRTTANWGDLNQGDTQLATAPGVDPDPVAGRTNFRTGEISPLTSTGIGQVKLNGNNPSNGIPGLTFNAGKNMPFGSSNLATSEIRPLNTVDPIEGNPQLANTSNLLNENGTLNSGGTGNAPTQGAGNMQQLLEAFKGQNPFGERATQMGEAITGLGLAANRPFYVNYGDIGREEINQQNIALQRAKGGEQAAINDSIAQTKAAREVAGGRSFQTLQSNLSNLSSRAGQTQAKIRGQFGRQEAALRTQIGARRTGIEQANFNIDRYQDDINTREYDTLWKENLKNSTNLRNMQLERQGAFNKFRKDQELMKLLQTQDFEYDANGELIFKKRSANVRTRNSDTTNNAAPSQGSYVNPGLQKFSYLGRNNQTAGLATGQGAALPNFSSQYGAGSPLGFMTPYELQFLNHKGLK